MRIGIFDCETNGLLVKLTKIHVLCIRILEDGVRGPVQRFLPDDMGKGLALLNSCDIIVGQNIISFDVPALEKVYPWWYPTAVIRDTLVISRMQHSNIKDKDLKQWKRGQYPGQLIGVHTLEAWGHRMNLWKGDYGKNKAEEGKALGLVGDDLVDFVWGTYTDEMGDYCEQDVEVTTKLWEQLCERRWSEDAMRLEHRIHHIMSLQENFGFHFDIAAALRLQEIVEEDYKKLRAECVAHFGKWFAPGKRYKGEPRTWAGEDDSRKVWAEVDVYKRKATITKGVLCPTEQTPDAPFCKVTLKEFNPGSRTQIIDRLETVYNWVPVDFTENDTPTVDDDVLCNLGQSWAICNDLAELFFLNKLLGQLANGANAWLKLVDADGIIHPYTNVGGTISGRASHLSPNIAQVPKVQSAKVLNDDGTFNKKVIDKRTGKPYPWALNEDGTPKKKTILYGRSGKYGFECRSLFSCPPGWWQMGCDLKGIELRCLAARLAKFDGGEYIREVLHGDPHTKNQIAFQVDSRDTAKTCLYACVPMDTQALTKSGWKHYDELNVGDMVLTYNVQKHVKEWQPVLEKVYYEDAPVIEMRTSKGFSVLSTPNHRWFTKKRRGGGRYYEEMVATTDEITSEHLIIKNAPMVCDNEAVCENLHTESKEAFVTGQRLKKIEHPRQPVWCISTINSSWVMRQGQTITITGNTMYGGGDLKIGSIVLPPTASDGEMRARGKQLKENLKTGIPAFGDLLNQVGNQAEKGFMIGLDGRKLWVRSRHAALNLQLQSDAALIAKLWVVMFYDAMEEAGYVFGSDWGLMAWIHDEVQAACRTKEIAEHAAKLCEEAAIAAGEWFNYAAPVEADSKIGKDWAACH